MKKLQLLLTSYLLWINAQAQFVDNFDGSASTMGKTPTGWTYNTGDGNASMKFIQKEGYASVYVDATKDKQGIWWALIRRQVPGIDLDRLMKPGHELRSEARIRVSHAPRRVNLHFNTQRTTDFHSHLMEYDLPDTVNWHVISFTTNGWDAQKGDLINAQMALMDWGLLIYRVDIDYFKVDIADRTKAGQDLGAQIPYHPPLADPASFKFKVDAVQDAMIDTWYTDMNFNNWKPGDANENVSLLTVSGTQYIIMRWDLSDFKGKKITRSGLLELTVHSLQRSPDYQKDFGMVRITEIIGGESEWDQSKVTYDLLCSGQAPENVLNTQMTIDDKIPGTRGSKAWFTISWPVLKRLIEGKTLGLAIKPLGAVNASFYSMENEGGKFSPKLFLDAE
ncbi:MAG TPA: hypothetical protein VI583_17135 [Cyclobacteriaceae bacterium]|nr:hypothetical protein [Cyclobacteriaceae bacterium]